MLFKRTGGWCEPIKAIFCEALLSAAPERESRSAAVIGIECKGEVLF